MADPFMKADMPTAMASGQYLFARVQAGDFKDHLKDVALCATTDLNFAAQALLKNNSDPAPTPGPVMFAGEPVNPKELEEKVACYEKIQKELNAPMGSSPVKGPLGDALLTFVGPLIDMAVTALKAFLGSLAKPKG